MAKKTVAPLSHPGTAQSYIHGLLLMEDRLLAAELRFWYEQALTDKDPFRKDSRARRCFEKLSRLTLAKPFYQRDRRAIMRYCLRLRHLTVFPLHIPNGYAKVVREQRREEIARYLPYMLVREIYIRVGTCNMSPEEVAQIWKLWRKASKEGMHFFFDQPSERTAAENLYLDIVERPCRVRQDISEAFVASTGGIFTAASFT